MSAVGRRGDRRKLDFRLVRDEDGYPPVDWESVWVEPTGDGTWRLDNIPFFVRDASNRDVVAARSSGGRLTFDRVVLRGGHSTLRILFEDLGTVGRVREALAKLGCSSEVSATRRLVAVDVRPTASLAAVRAFLESEAVRSDLEYEDACIQHEAN